VTRDGEKKKKVQPRRANSLETARGALWEQKATRGGEAKDEKTRYGTPKGKYAANQSELAF
jgi:hypothetical protein